MMFTLSVFSIYSLSNSFKMNQKNCTCLIITSLTHSALTKHLSVELKTKLQYGLVCLHCRTRFIYMCAAHDLVFSAPQSDSVHSFPPK